MKNKYNNGFNGCPDLANDHDDEREFKDRYSNEPGMIYRKGLDLQVQWATGDIENSRAPTEEASKDIFSTMCPWLSNTEHDQNGTN